MSEYRDVIFLQDPEEFDRWYVEFDESGQQGFEYLLQWEYGEGEIRITPPWGSNDTVEWFFDGNLTYVVSYNWHLQYVSLTEVIG